MDFLTGLLCGIAAMVPFIGRLAKQNKRLNGFSEYLSRCLRTTIKGMAYYRRLAIQYKREAKRLKAEMDADGEGWKQA